MVSTARIWSCVSTLEYPKPTGASPKALNLHEGVRFIAWRLTHPFLEECRWGPRHFWSHWARLDDSRALGPTLKFVCLVGRVGCKSVEVLPNCNNPVEGHTSTGCGICSTDLFGCVTSLDTVLSRGWLTREPRRPRLIFLELQRAVQPSSNPPWRG